MPHNIVIRKRLFRFKDSLVLFLNIVIESYCIFFMFSVCVNSQFFELFKNRLIAQALKIFYFKIVKLRYKRVNFFYHAKHIVVNVFLRVLSRRDIAFYDSVDFALNHIINICSKVFAFKYTASLLIEFFPLDIHNVVVFKYAFSYVKVIGFNFSLRSFYLPCNQT